MKGNREILAESLRLLMTSRWFWRIFTVLLILIAMQNLANGAVAAAYERLGLQTWAQFLVKKAEAMQAGLDYSVPSRAVAAGMNHATAFALFIALVFGGITRFGAASIALKAVRGDDARWCHDSFGGLERPLGVAWLGFNEFLRIALWSMLFVVPGIVALYGYSQCWFVRVDHPEWGASRCLLESLRLMRDAKARRFALDMAFAAMAIALALACAGLSLLGVHPGVSLPFCGFFLFLWMVCARGVFYRELTASAGPGGTAQEIAVAD